MTGWQGNEGGYGGGFGPQPDPQSGQYSGAYGQEQFPQYQQQYPQPGANPYEGQYYSSDPYASNPYQAYPGYQPGYGPPEPPKRSKVPIVLSIVAILAVVGTVLTIVLINRDSGQPAATGGSSSTSKPPPVSSAAPPSSRRPPSSGAAPPPTKDGWTTVEMPGGTYQVPGDWTKKQEPRESGLTGITFVGGATVGTYDCGGSPYFRGFTAGGEVQAKDGSQLDLNKTVTDFANSFAGRYYASPKVDVPTPQPTTVSGQDAATVTAKLTVTPAKPECDATSGEVAVTGVAIKEGGKLVGVRLLVVVNDLAGGPATPAPPPDPLAEEILTTLSITG